MKIIKNHQPEKPEKHESHGFVVPDGYFTSAKQQILSKTVGNTVPSDGFRLPEQYFEMAKQKILQKTIGKQPLQIQNYKWFQQPYFRIAASVVLISGIMMLLMVSYQGNNKLTEKSLEPSTEDIFTYMENNSEISINEIGYITPNEIEIPTTIEENYILNQADEHLLTEEL